MRSSAGQHFLRLVGGLLTAAGLFAWIGLIWTAFSDFDSVTPQSDEGGRLMRRALTGTLLMILGMVILHLGQDADESDTEDDQPPQG